MPENKKVISLIHDEFEDLELWYPILRLQEAGAIVHIVGETAGKKYTGKYGVPAYAEFELTDIVPAEYDGLLVPGGWAPDKLRRDQRVLSIVREMDIQGKVIGQICHAGWVLVSAGILAGKTVTSTPGIKDDMTNAGAIWLDKPVVVDGNIVSSRRPADLPAYMKAYLEVLSGNMRQKPLG